MSSYPETQTKKKYTLSIDTGGTFTDGFVSDGIRSFQIKVDTTPHDLTVGFRQCVVSAAEAVGETLSSFLAATQRIHFSSTIATNTVVERAGARVGLIVTAGAENNLYGSQEEADRLFDFLDPELVHRIQERIDEKGQVQLEPSTSDVETAINHLLQRGVRMLVVCLGNAHLNPANEQKVREIINWSYPRHYLGAVPLLLSSQISLAPENHGRTAAAVINAYLHPKLVRNLYRAEDDIRTEGLRYPLLIVNTDGSSTRVAKSRALDTFNSGPSAGVLGSAFVAQALGARHVCTFDVGGTTTDVAYIQDGIPPHMPTTEIGRMRIPHPSIDLSSFGVGGGSIISIDSNGKLRVGPESTGSAPGPACFGLGGEHLTPTDVWLMLGYLQPGEFLGGRRRLDRELAERALGQIAERLNISLEAAALEALEAIRSTLSSQLLAWSERQPGLSLDTLQEDGWLFSYGGGGGLLCVDAAEALGIPRVVVFPHSSVFSAFGGGLLPISHTYSGVVPSCEEVRVVEETVAKLVGNAIRDLRAEGVTELEKVSAKLNLRPFDHTGEVTIDGITLAELQLKTLDSAAIRELGDGVAHCVLHVTVEREVILDVRNSDEQAGDGVREIVTPGGSLRIPILGGLGVPGAPSMTGPAFLEAHDTTIFVPENWSVSFTQQGYGILTKEVNNR